MGQYDKKREGEPLEISASVWNKLLEMLTQKGQPGLSTPLIDGQPSKLGGPRLSGSSSSAFDSWKLLKATSPQLTDEQSLLFDLSMDLAAAGAGGVYAAERSGRYAHLGYKSGENEEVRLTYAGIVPAKIYVHDENHRFVDLPYTNTQSDLWESDWDGPHEILWKETGTGEGSDGGIKAVLRLGENRPRILWGRTKEAWRKRGGIPSQGNKWAYVNVELLDYTAENAGPESETSVRVLLPTNYDQDPNVPANVILGFMKAYQRSERQYYSGFAMEAWPTYRYVAVTPNYFSSCIGDTKILLRQSDWSCPGWAKVDGSQDTDKTCSGEAADASDRFLFFQKEASESGGDNTASFLSKDVIDNIAAHPDHTHPQNQTLVAGEGGPDLGHIPDANTGNGGAAGHSATDPDHEIEIDNRPAWQGARLYERIDNSAGDEE